MSSRSLYVAWCIVTVCASASAALWLSVTASKAARAQTVEELRDLSIEQLMNVEVISVLKRPQPIATTPAAVYVITSEDIRRSGARTLPEVLRLAPNLQVAQINAQSYAISARGFNSGQASNKLLVMVDGRSVYSPLHSGVFWDQVGVNLDDVDHIEVVSGPGGTAWGANAVNGVINIVTKSAHDTQGGIADVTLGTVNDTLTARYGGEFGDDGAYRFYVKGYDRGPLANPDGSDADDGWGGGQAGFRFDWGGDVNSFTLSGDAYRDTFDDAPGDLSGHNLTGHWHRRLDGGGSVSVRAYYDNNERSGAGINDKVNTFDISAQHTFLPNDWNTVVWGAGYRLVDDEFVNTANAFTLEPPSRTLHLGNIFAQDSIDLTDDLTLTLGTKIEYSSFSGVDVLPSARLGWEVTDTDFLWAAVSRVVRTPNRIERELEAPGILVQAPDFDSEKLIAYELGYRGQPTPQTSLSVSLYYNVYDDLRTTEPAFSSTLPLQLKNGMEATTYGVEVWGDYRPRPWWRLTAGIDILREDFDIKPGHVDLSGKESAGNDPDYKFSLRSYMDLPHGLEFDVGFRAVSDLDHPPIPAYTAVDARLGWHVTDRLELSIGAINAFDDRHPESIADGPQLEVRRQVYVRARLRF